jgi:hypothetical protein
MYVLIVLQVCVNNEAICCGALCICVVEKRLQNNMRKCNSISLYFLVLLSELRYLDRGYCRYHFSSKRCTTEKEMLEM